MSTAQKIVSVLLHFRQDGSREKYAGRYGAYCCGNFTVFHNAELDTLTMEYGVSGNANLVSIDDENDQFVLVFREPMW